MANLTKKQTKANVRDLELFKIIRSSAFHRKENPVFEIGKIERTGSTDYDFLVTVDFPVSSDLCDDFEWEQVIIPIDYNELFDFVVDKKLNTGEEMTYDERGFIDVKCDPNSYIEEDYYNVIVLYLHDESVLL